MSGRWYKAAVTVSFSASDNAGGSGFAYTECQLDGGSWTPGTSASISGEGPHTLLYRSADGAGNVEPYHTLSCGIDTVRPTTTAYAGTAIEAGQPSSSAGCTTPLPTAARRL